MSATDATTTDEVWSALDTIAAAGGGYNASECVECAFGRILVLGPPKIGKTTALVETAPGPVCVINADGDSALRFPASRGARYIAFDARNAAEWTRARISVEKAVKAGAKSVILDSLSVLGMRLGNELPVLFPDKFDVYREMKAHLEGGVMALLNLQAHVFIVCHIDAGHGVKRTKEDGLITETAVIPLLSGSAKTSIPTIVDDVVRFEFNPEATPSRRFIVGSQSDWTMAGRGVRRSCIIEADATLLLKEFGIRP